MTAALLLCQDKKPEDKLLHVTVVPNTRLTALSIEREAAFPSVVQLRGNVEIKRLGMILYCDEAEYHEDTLEIEARGNVHVKPYPAPK